MQIASSRLVFKSSMELFRFGSGLSLIACLALILTNPFKQTRHIQMECPPDRIPATLIQDENRTLSAACLLVESMPRNPSLWVY